MGFGAFMGLFLIFYIIGVPIAYYITYFDWLDTFKSHQNKKNIAKREATDNCVHSWLQVFTVLSLKHK